MNSDAIAAIAKLLASFEPRWVLLIVAAAILAYKSPQLLRELFTGLQGLRVTRRQKKSTKRRAK